MSNGEDQEISVQQGQVLVRLARQTIMVRFGQEIPAAESAWLEEALRDPAFERRSGTFVCLKLNGQLRGCIGSLVADGTIAESVRGNALNAAFRDPRFSPLEAEDLERISLEVSVLTEPQPLAYQDGNDLLAKLQPGIDGVILRKGIATATFLPQVWEQLPQPADFLSHLCQKAGLAPDAWQRQQLEVLTYRVQYFSEP